MQARAELEDPILLIDKISAWVQTLVTFPRCAARRRERWWLGLHNTGSRVHTPTYASFDKGSLYQLKFYGQVP